MAHRQSGVGPQAARRPWTTASSAASKARWLAINTRCIGAGNLVCVGHVYLLLNAKTLTRKALVSALG